MKESFNINSLSAYLGVLPNIGTKQWEVLEAIRTLGVCSDKEILRYLQKREPSAEWEINKITNRRGELKGRGLIIEAEGDFYNEAHYPIDKWRIKRGGEKPQAQETESHLRPDVLAKLELERVNQKLL